jgi:opacity protein-like surface antigen
MQQMQDKKRKTISKTLFALAVVFFFACSLAAQAENMKIRISVKRANVRLKPTLQSQTIGTALEGQVFEALQTTGDWYRINLPPDSSGVTVFGYVHKSVVQEVEEKVSARAPDKAAIPTQEPPDPKPKSVSPLPARLSETSGSSPFRPARKKFFVRLSGGYNSMTYPYESNWSFPLYHEDGLVAEDYEIKASGVALDAGIGYLFHKNVGVELSFIPASGKSRGTFSASFPHPLYFDTPREETWENGSLRYSASELNLNLLFIFPLFSRLHAYVTAGGTYFLNVKIENLKVINWEEVGYPYFEVNVSPEYASYSQNVFGFNGGAGLDYWIAQSMGINVHFGYSDGKAKFDIEGNEIEIKTGGLRAMAGIKFIF